MSDFVWVKLDRADAADLHREAEWGDLYMPPRARDAFRAALSEPSENQQKASKPGLPTGQFFSGQNEINRLKTNAEYWRRKYMKLAGSLEND